MDNISLSARLLLVTPGGGDEEENKENPTEIQGEKSEKPDEEMKQNEEEDKFPGDYRSNNKDAFT